MCRKESFRVVEHIFDSFGAHYIRYLMRVRHGTDTAMAYGCVNECRRGYHATLYMDMRVNKAGEEVRSSSCPVGITFPICPFRIEISARRCAC